MKHLSFSFEWRVVEIKSVDIKCVMELHNVRNFLVFMKKENPDADAKAVEVVLSFV
jgi:hypothetical protein